MVMYSKNNAFVKGNKSAFLKLKSTNNITIHKKYKCMLINNRVVTIGMSQYRIYEEFSMSRQHRLAMSYIMGPYVTTIYKVGLKSAK